MMDPAGWLQKAFDELLELGPAAEGDPADAWRAGVLMARLLGSPASPVPPTAIVSRLPQILAAAGPPDAQEILDRVADELDSDTDPWGTLLDAILDVDDAVGLLTLSGQVDTALALAQRVAGLVSLYPERVFALGAFADMRLATIREDACVSNLWSAVERAPATFLAGTLPPAGSSPHLVRQRPARPTGTLALPRDLWRDAAATVDARTVKIDSGDGRYTGWIEQDAGEMRLELRGADAPPARVVLLAHGPDGAMELGRAELPVQIAGRTSYVLLGPSSGPGNVLQKLLAATGRTPEDVSMVLVVADD